MIVSDLVHTCEACPSQWEGRCGDRRVYVRYRWGWLSVRVSKKGSDDVGDAVRGIEVYGEQLGHDMDGSLEWPEVERRIAGLDLEAEMAKAGLP